MSADLSPNAKAGAGNYALGTRALPLGNVSGNVFGDSLAKESSGPTLLPSFGTIRDRTRCEVP